MPHGIISKVSAFMTLDEIDHLEDHNELLILLEAELVKDNLNKQIHIRHLFALWQALLEGINCEDFDKNFLVGQLNGKYDVFVKNFSKDADFNFMLGWILSISPWYFKNSLTEDDGSRLLYKAYKLDSKNSLFKWALRDQLNVSQKEIERLADDIRQNCNNYFSFGSKVQRYFLELI